MHALIDRLRGLLRKRPTTGGASADQRLNEALDLALDWGNWLSPIQARLRALHPELDDAALDALNATCTEAVRFGHACALRLSSTVDAASVQGRFEFEFAERYPWVSRGNLERAYRHSIYYATKTARVGSANP